MAESLLTKCESENEKPGYSEISQNFLSRRFTSFNIFAIAILEMIGITHFL